MIVGKTHDRRVGILAGYLFSCARSVYEKPDFPRLSLEQTKEQRLFARFPKDDIEFTRVVEKFLSSIGKSAMNPVGIKIIYTHAGAEELQVLLVSEKGKHVLTIRNDGDYELAGYANFASKEPLYDALGLSDPMQIALVKIALVKIQLEHELFKTALDAKDTAQALAAVGEIRKRKSIVHLAAIAIHCENERVAMAAFQNFAAHRVMESQDPSQLDYEISNIAKEARCQAVKHAARNTLSEIQNSSRPPHI